MKSRYCIVGNTLFRMDENGMDYWINPKHYEHWNEVDYEHGPHPSYDYPELNEYDALDFALTLGMKQNAFFE